LIISFDLNQINFGELKDIIENIHIDNEESSSTKKIEIPVCCDEPYSLDLSELEKKLNLEKEKILDKFFKNEYFCYMTGFIAGMPFLGDINEDLRAKRLETPRVKVPKGSIGITEQFTNIYTFESPGGWNIIGNTPLNVFDSSKEVEPNLINPGDTVTFKRISKDDYLNYE
jgi:KipI family sensor histidine kinase inhibitor